MTQDYKQIEDLIARFFDGLSSNAEERELYAFFSQEEIPAHLQSYQPVFTYFETGINEEVNQPKVVQPVKIQTNQKKTLLWISIAASLLVFISIRLLYMSGTPDFDPYEGSYIIRNGVKITDPKIVRPEIEKTLQTAMLQEAEYEELLEEINESEILYLQLLEEELKQEQMELLNQYPDDALEILSIKL
ncbi:hypothetical protein FACS189432_00780 [Bacteroidia bacterium]|nr:hypothetical protein FACS189432_00780 [Bacteroidia bacterium]